MEIFKDSTVASRLKPPLPQALPAGLSHACYMQAALREVALMIFDWISFKNS